MSNKQKLINARRRTFLQSSALLTAASAGAATTAVASTTSTENLQQPADEIKGSAGYKETDRVRRYYKMARF